MTIRTPHSSASQLAPPWSQQYDDLFTAGAPLGWVFHDDRLCILFLFSNFLSFGNLYGTLPYIIYCKLDAASPAPPPLFTLWPNMKALVQVMRSEDDEILNNHSQEQKQLQMCMWSFLNIENCIYKRTNKKNLVGFFFRFNFSPPPFFPWFACLAPFLSSLWHPGFFKKHRNKIISANCISNDKRYSLQSQERSVLGAFCGYIRRTRYIHHRLLPSKVVVYKSVAIS